MSLPQEPFLSPWEYITKQKGKGLRDVLIDGLNIWINADQESVLKTKRVINDLHNASLLIDDIEDNSTLRRGFTTAHLVYGVPLTINAANYVYLHCINILRDETAAQQVCIDEMINLHKGQGKELYWRDTNDDFVLPSLEDYVSMISDKTGGLFRMAAKLLCIFANVSYDPYIPLMNKIAEYYQIRDDLINLTSSSYQDTKGYCEDLTEGKLSFPILYALGKDITLLDEIRAKKSNYDEKKIIVEKIASLGAFEYTKDYLEGVKQEINIMMNSFPENTFFTQLLM